MSDNTEIVFSPDFAARVLGEADRIAARHRRQRRLAGSAAAAAASLAFVFLVFVPTGRPHTGSKADVPRLVDMPLQASSDRSDDPDALGYLFPDAEPVARFAAQYSEQNDSGSALDLLGDEDAGTP
jgi:hypothetical protein